MNMNLQFFAEEGAGAEVTEPAAQSEPVNESVDTGVTEGPTSPEGAQTSPDENNGLDMNAIFANARRRAEAEYKKKQDARDAEFARRFGNYTNPETGKAILTEADYFEALDAQERVKAKEELTSKGVDLQTIENLINNSPRLRQAEQMLNEYKAKQIEQNIQNDLAELNKLDPNITSLETVPKEVMETANAKGYTLLDAYKVSFFGKVSEQQASAIRQNTINKISGKSHLAPVNGVATTVSGVDIPADKLASWRELWPGISDSELRKRYNQALNGRS